jgi:hypothetical protein
VNHVAVRKETHLLGPDPSRLRDQPLTSEDLDVCNTVLNEISLEFDIAPDMLTVSRLASIIIELFRQGVRDPEQLKLLAAATREEDAP